MEKKTLGIAIPYYKNSDVCVSAMLGLMLQLRSQITDDMLVCIVEDGQYSNFLDEYIKDYEHYRVIRLEENKGVSVARNICINQLINEVKYILFIDSDDVISDDYLKIMCDYCNTGIYDLYESAFSIYTKVNIIPFRANENRYGVIGQAFSTKIIGHKRFDPKLQIGEDTKFNADVFKLDKHKKCYVKEAMYCYKLGLNKNSLTMLFSAKKIKESRCETCLKKKI